MKESYNVFKELIEKYPDSNYSDDARKRMIFIYQKLAKRIRNCWLLLFNWKLYCIS